MVAARGRSERPNAPGESATAPSVPPPCQVSMAPQRPSMSRSRWGPRVDGDAAAALGGRTSSGTGTVASQLENSFGACRVLALFRQARTGTVLVGLSLPICWRDRASMCRVSRNFDNPRRRSAAIASLCDGHIVARPTRPIHARVGSPAINQPSSGPRHDASASRSHGDARRVHCIRATFGADGTPFARGCSS